MPEQLLRLARFRDAHPAVAIHHDQHFGVWYATIPLKGGEAGDYASSGHFHENDLGKLLDELDRAVAPEGG
jgi:hypothetical protein